MEKLGPLVRRMVTYWTNHEPQTALKWLKEGTLGDHLIEIAMHDLSLVHSMGTDDMQRTCLWSDMMSSGQLGVFPPETEGADGDTRKKIRMLLKMQEPWLVEEALERKNVARDWTPENNREYERAEA